MPLSASPLRQSLTRHECRVAGEVIRYHVIRSKRRTLSLQVSRDGTVSVRAPLSAGAGRIHALVAEKAGWILRHLRRFEGQTAQANRWEPGGSLLYLGNECRIEVERGLRDAICLDGNRLAVSMARLSEDRLRPMLEAWLKREAQAVFTARFPDCLARVAALGIRHDGQFRLRRMRSRWGSCSSRGDITLNSALIHTPEACIDYVILHELCHLKEHNHGPAFYRLMTQAMPDWECHRRMLKNIHI